MTIPEGRKALDAADLAQLAGNPSTWEEEVKMLTAQLEEAKARIEALETEIKAKEST